MKNRNRSLSGLLARSDVIVAKLKAENDILKKTLYDATSTLSDDDEYFVISGIKP